MSKKNLVTYHPAAFPQLKDQQPLYFTKQFIAISNSIKSLKELLENPWVSFTPALTPGSGALTTATASGRYKQIGKLVFFTITIAITTNGTAATNLAASLPVAVASGENFVIPGRETSGGKMLQGLCNASSVTITNYDTTYPGADGANLVVSGSYETV